MPNDYAARVGRLPDHPAWAELEKGLEVRDKEVYTSSKLKVLGTCPWLYPLMYGDKPRPEERRNLKAERGTVVHATIHAMHDIGHFEGWQGVFKGHWDMTINAPEMEGVPYSKEFSERERKTIKDDAESMVRQYVAEELSDKIVGDVVGTELRFFMLLKHPRTGTLRRYSGEIDQVRVLDDGDFWIGDLKTGAIKPSDAYLASATQFSGYGYALKHALFEMPNGDLRKFDKYPAWLSWMHMMNLVPYKKAGKRGDGTRFRAGDSRGRLCLITNRTEKAYDRFVVETMRKIQQLKMGILYAADDPIKCSMCHYQQACAERDFDIDLDPMAMEL